MQRNFVDVHTAIIIGPHCHQIHITACSTYTGCEVRSSHTLVALCELSALSPLVAALCILPRNVYIHHTHIDNHTICIANGVRQ